MDNLALTLISTFFIGLGAVLTLNLWSKFLNYAFKITLSNVYLV